MLNQWICDSKKLYSRYRSNRRSNGTCDSVNRTDVVSAIGLRVTPYGRGHVSAATTTGFDDVMFTLTMRFLL